VIQPHCLNESDTLRQVIIGSCERYRNITSVEEANNEKQAKHFVNGDLPTRETLVPEFERFASAMRECGIEVFTPDPCSEDTGSRTQLFTRDIGFVIGDTFFLATMKMQSRKREFEGIKKYLDLISPAQVCQVPEDVILEGGDIVVDKGSVFVGVGGQRTTTEGVKFLERALHGTGLTVVPVALRSLDRGEDVLHLDCAFVPVGAESALVYPEGIDQLPAVLSRTYDLIPVEREEQDGLELNVLAISPSRVISRDSAKRVNDEMQKRGIDVVEIAFNEAPMVGGSLRCCTLPLVRG